MYWGTYLVLGAWGCKFLVCRDESPHDDEQELGFLRIYVTGVFCGVEGRIIQ